MQSSEGSCYFRWFLRQAFRQHRTMQKNLDDTLRAQKRLLYKLRYIRILQFLIIITLWLIMINNIKLFQCFISKCFLCNLVWITLYNWQREMGTNFWAYLSKDSKSFPWFAKKINSTSKIKSYWSFKRPETLIT